MYAATSGTVIFAEQRAELTRGSSGGYGLVDISDEKEGSDDNMSMNTLTVQIIRERGECKTMHVWSNNSIEAPIEKD